MFIWLWFWITLLSLSTIVYCKKIRDMKFMKKRSEAKGTPANPDKLVEAKTQDDKDDRDKEKPKGKDDKDDDKKEDKEKDKEKNEKTDAEKKEESKKDDKKDEEEDDEDKEREERRKRRQNRLEKLKKERECMVKEALEKGNLRPADDNETINECQSDWNGPVAKKKT